MINDQLLIINDQLLIIDDQLFTARRQSIRDYRWLLDEFVERSWLMCKNFECKVTDVHSVCMTMLENEKNLLEDRFKFEQRTKFCNGILNRLCHFEMVMLKKNDHKTRLIIQGEVFLAANKPCSRQVLQLRCSSWYSIKFHT